MIRLASCGFHFIHDGFVVNRPSGFGKYVFIFYKSSTEIVLPGHPTIHDKNVYILMRPTSAHQYRDLEKPFINDWFHFDGEDLEEFLSQIHFPVDTPVKAADPFLISRSVQELYNLIRQSSPLQEQIIDCEIRSLLMKLSTLQQKTAAHAKTNRYFLQFSELRSQLYSSPSVPYSVDMLASRVNLSRSYFQHVYKELFGCSVMTDIINARLEYAKYLLDSSSLSVQAISQMCGYENETHFLRQFKKFVGVSPGRYKAGS